MMRDVIPANEILSKAHAVGQYYGFTPFSTYATKGRGMNTTKSVYPKALESVELDPFAQTVTHFLKQCQRIEHVPSARQPLFLWHTNIAPGRKAQKKVIVQFHALGTDRAIADAVIIRAVSALIQDLCHETPVLRVNSMGDKETRARYARELGVFFKKRGASLPEECVACAKDDAFGAAEMVIARECAEDLPTPTEHLSDASRKRFEDLLEYLEMTETPYELARDLISRGNAWNDTCFELTVGGKPVAWGSHYNELARHFYTDAPISASGAILTLTSEGALVKKAPRPRQKVSFIHIGDEAKRISIGLAEEFRKARVPLTQYIGTESLTEQIGLADRDNNPYLLIMGRKEALEHSAILRNRQTQIETVLPLDGIIDQLKAVA